MIRPTVFCDVCEKPKGSANHWFLVVIDERGLTLYSWKEADARLPGMQHLCGRECVNRTVNKVLDVMGGRNGNSGSKQTTPGSGD